MTYYEQLKDPRWQKKRLQIFQRDKWTCQSCFTANGNTLHVHHGYYEKGKMAWEYEDETLHTVCEDCHEEIESTKRDLHYEIGKIKPGLLCGLMRYILYYRSEIKRINKLADKFRTHA